MSKMSSVVDGDPCYCGTKVAIGWVALASVAQLVGASSCKLKGYGFNSLSGPLPRVAGSVPGWGAYERQLINVSLSH